MTDKPADDISAEIFATATEAIRDALYAMATATILTKDEETLIHNYRQCAAHVKTGAQRLLERGLPPKDEATQ